MNIALYIYAVSVVALVLLFAVSAIVEKNRPFDITNGYILTAAVITFVPIVNTVFLVFTVAGFFKFVCRR